ncbi:hypothetical protein ACFZ8E_15060 [Methylobacterium sp. HMF5984]|uniref:hypothetical protein n=1 Tax=Methylobacterium sp. HMF5984 TaxID=3367370 RepID=UPI003854AC5C
MSKKHKPRPETYPEDSEATRETLAWLCKQRLAFVRCSRYHIRIGDLNFYPDKGTIYRSDDLGALPETGLTALQHILTRTGKVGTTAGSSPPRDTGCEIAFDE